MKFIDPGVHNFYINWIIDRIFENIEYIVNFFIFFIVLIQFIVDEHLYDDHCR